MKDWKAIAKANGIAPAGKELDSLTQPLEALEAIFRPLAKDLSPDLEPAVYFCVEAGIE